MTILRNWKYVALLLGMCLAILSPTVLLAQRITGAVRDSAGLAPLSGAVVILTDSGSTTARQYLTDARGRFTIPADQSWAHLRIIHIGFTPVEVENRSGASMPLDIRMVPFVMVLSTVRSSARAVCGSSEAGGNATVTLWDQARMGLLANVLGRRAIPATATVLNYHQVFDTLGINMLSQRTTRSSGRQQRPFGAVAAASVFATTGFVVDQDNSREYRAPDADVLLDPAFSANHCFDIMLDERDHSGEVGLTFRPAGNGKTGIVDVAGTLWLDAKHLQLNAMSFHYVNIEAAAARAGAGGSLRFTTMQNGIVALTHWSLTAPVIRHQAGSRLGSATLPGHDYLTEIDRIGGVLANATWPDGAAWQAPLGTVVGRAVRGEARTPVSGVRVWIENTNNSAISDTTGTFRFSDVLPGDYTIHLEDTSLAGTGAERDVDVNTTVKVGKNMIHPDPFPGYADIFQKFCGRSKHQATSVLLFGRLVANFGPINWPTDVRMTWPEVGTSAIAKQHVDAKSEGRFYVCGIPAGRIVSVRVQRDTTVQLDTVVTAPLTKVGVVTFLLKSGGH